MRSVVRHSHRCRHVVHSKYTLQLHSKYLHRAAASMNRKFFDFVLESTANDNQQSASPSTTLTNDDYIEHEHQTQEESQIAPFSMDQSVRCPINSRFARASIIGMPNAGKSSLLNRLINHPVSAVSSKVNTTREQTVGCLTVNNIQIEFVDTPGILPLSLLHPQRDRKQHNLHYEAWSSVYKSDIIMLVIDPTNKSQQKNLLIAQQLSALNKSEIDKLVLVINKCDLFWPHTKLYELAELFNNECKFDITLIVSAKHWRRIDKLKGYLLSHIGSAVNEKSAKRYSRRWKFESHLKSNMSREDEIVECVRAKLYQRAHQEVPYNVELEIEGPIREEDQKMFVDVVVSVKRRSHQNMLNGAAGQQIRQWAARDLTTRFGKDVVIKLKTQLA